MRGHALTLLLALLVLWPGAPSPAQPSQAARWSAEFTRLSARYDRESQAYFKAKEAEYKRAKTDEQRRKVDYIRGNPYGKYAPAIRSLEKRARGTEPGIKALGWLLNNATMPGVSKQAARDLLKLLPGAYLRSPGLEQIAQQTHYLFTVCGVQPVRDSLQTIARESPHRKVRAAALFTLAQIQSDLADATKGLPDTRRTIQKMRATSSPADIKMMEEYIALIEQNPVTEESVRPLFAQVQKEYGDTIYARKADRYLYALDNLGVGQEAPDFQATDQDGRKFRLSDYRGKVVALDFWGFW